MRRGVVGGVALLLLLAIPPAAATETISANTSLTTIVAHESWHAYKVDVAFGSSVTVSFRAQGIVDYFVFTESQYNEYTNPSVPRIGYEASQMNTQDYTYPTGRSGLVFVIDNARITEVGAIPTGEVTYTLTVAYTSRSILDALFVQSPCPGWIALAIVLVLGSSYWVLTPPKRYRERSAQLKAVLK